MAPSIFNFKELRRRSRASFRTDSSSDGSQGTTPTSGSITPPSINGQSDPALNLQLKDVPTIPIRPPLQTNLNGSGNRYSVSGMHGLGSPTTNGKSTLPVSQYAPRIANIAENAWVSQKILLIHGTAGDPTQHRLDGTLIVSRMDDNFPPVSWPVSDSHFKALVYLLPGANKLRFEFASPKLANSASSNPIHASYLTVHMLPQTNAPPLQLAILAGKDSPCTFDAVPARIEREGNGLEAAVRKFRMAAYLWQAFTAEQMYRNRLGRRAFRFEEEWTTGTSNIRDRELGMMRSEAKIHIIRTDKTVAELRDLDNAQQNEKAKNKDALFGIAADAVKDYFKPLPGQKLYVSVLLLDAHWDKSAKTIVGHAALGGGVGDIQLAIFGSHCLQSYPGCFEDVVPAFTDCTPTDNSLLANDCGDAGSSWEAANLGIGAHLHETGHLFGCPHQANGVMLRDYVVLNRSFVAREAYATRTRSKGGLVIDHEEECTWHRLDCLRFRAHPCFRLPNDPIQNPDESVQAFPIEGGHIMVTAATGVAFVEIYGEGDDVCRSWIEYPIDSNGSGSGTGPQRQVTLREIDLRERLPETKRQGGRLRLAVKSHGGGSLDIDDFKKLASKESSFKLANGKQAFRSKKLGMSAMDGTAASEVVFESALKQNRVLARIVFHTGLAVDGLEFVYDDGSRQQFGKQGGSPKVFDLDVRRGEYITGFYVRSGFWIDAIQVLTSMGRRSPLYGNSHGGSPSTLIPPRGYTICGVSGTCGGWVDGFSVLITR